MASYSDSALISQRARDSLVKRMVRPGMGNPRGKPIAPLVGPLRWAVDVCGERNSEVAIERQPLPAEPKPAEIVASLRAMGFERELCE